MYTKIKFKLNWFFPMMRTITIQFFNVLYNREISSFQSRDMFRYHRRKRRRGQGASAPFYVKKGKKWENVSEDIFLDHSGRFFPPPKLFCSPTAMLGAHLFVKVNSLEINSDKCEIIRTLNFGEYLYFRDHPNPMRKKEKISVHLQIYWFEHSGRFIVPPPPPNCFALLRS